MPEPRIDPFDALRAPIIPMAPNPRFAADLRNRLRAVLAPTTKEPGMNTNLTTRPRNGRHHGDVSYITLGLPDLARGRAFYGAVLGWRFSPGSSEHGAQVDDTVPMIGLWEGEQPAGGRVHGAVLGFRVDDIEAAVGAVRAHGGTVGDPHPEPYAMAAEGHDDQGIPFYLHEMPSAGDSVAADGEFHNGDVEGDVSYLTMVVPDLAAAQAFYGGVFGWTFNVGRAGGAQVTGVAPQIGMTTEPEAGPATPGTIMCYRVDDIEAAVRRVQDAGGRSGQQWHGPTAWSPCAPTTRGLRSTLHQILRPSSLCEIRTLTSCPRPGDSVWRCRHAPLAALPPAGRWSSSAFTSNRRNVTRSDSLSPPRISSSMLPCATSARSNASSPASVMSTRWRRRSAGSRRRSTNSRSSRSLSTSTPVLESMDKSSVIPCCDTPGWSRR